MHTNFFTMRTILVCLALLLSSGVAAHECCVNDGTKTLPAPTSSFTHVHALSEVQGAALSTRSIALRLANAELGAALTMFVGIAMERLAIYSAIDASQVTDQWATLSVRHLELHRVEGADEALRKLGRVKSLETVYVAGNSAATGAFLGDWSQPSLRHVGIASFTQFDPLHLHKLPTRLHTLSYSGTRSSGVIAAASSMSALRSLTIARSDPLSDDVEPDPPIGTCTFPPGLRTITLTGAILFQPASLSRLWSLEFLSECILDGFCGLRPESFSALGNARALRRLVILPAYEEQGQLWANEASIDGLRSLRCLEELCLSGRLGSEVIMKLKDVLANCKRFELRDDGVDSGICDTLKRAVNLTHLALNITHFAPLMLAEALRSLDHLSSIELAGPDLGAMIEACHMVPAVRFVHFVILSKGAGDRVSLPVCAKPLPPSVTSVTLSHFGALDASLAGWLCSKSVKAIKLCFLTNVGEVVPSLFRATTVESLSLYACQGFITGMFVASKTTRCATVSVGLCADFTDTMLDALSGLDSLRVLAIEHCSQITLEGVLRQKRLHSKSIEEIRWAP